MSLRAQAWLFGVAAGNAVILALAVLLIITGHIDAPTWVWATTDVVGSCAAYLVAGLVLRHG